MCSKMKKCWNNKMLFWQIIVCTTSFMAYMLHYFCKSELYVVVSDFRRYLNPNDEADAQKWLGIILALGYASYALGKMTFALITDAILKSGVKSLLITLIFAPLFSALLTINFHDYTLRIAMATIFWFILRFVLAAGWVGIVKIIVHWIPSEYRGQVMGVINLSWMFGDAIARASLGFIYSFENNHNWRVVFWSASIMTAITILPTYVLIKDLPSHRNLPLIEDNEERKDVDTKKKDEEKINATKKYVEMDMDDDVSSNEGNNGCKSVWIILKPLLSNFLFWMVLIMNFQYIFIRELFNVYFVDYLEHFESLSTSDAASISALFPLFGAVSSIVCGVWLDKIKSKHWKLSVLPIFSIVNALCLSVFAFIDPEDLTVTIVIFVVIMYGLSFYGPYSLLSGAVAQDIGGQKSSAMVSGFVSAAGYSAGIVVTSFSSFYGYIYLWRMATYFAIGGTICGIIIFIYNKRIHDKTKDHGEESISLISTSSV